MEARLGDALRLIGVEDVTDLALSEVQLARVDCFSSLVERRHFSLAERAGFSLADARPVSRTGRHVIGGAFLDAAEVMADEVGGAGRAVLARVFALGAPWGALSADGVARQGHPYLGRTQRTAVEADPGRLKHLEAGSAFEADVGVVARARRATLVAQVAGAELVLWVDGSFVGDRQSGGADVDARVREVVQVGTPSTAGAEVGRVLVVTSRAVGVARHALALILHGDVQRASLPALVAEEERPCIRQGLIAACAAGQAALARLARCLAQLASLRGVDAVVRAGALVHARVAQEVCAGGALEALVGGSLTPLAASIAWCADAVNFVVAARAVISARPLEEEGQERTSTRVASQALLGLAERALPAGPVAVGRHSHAAGQLIDEEAVLGQGQSRERVCHLGDPSIPQALQLYLERGAATERSMRVDLFQGEGVCALIEGAFDIAEGRAVNPAGQLISVDCPGAILCQREAQLPRRCYLQFRVFRQGMSCRQLQEN